MLRVGDVAFLATAKRCMRPDWCLRKITKIADNKFFTDDYTCYDYAVSYYNFMPEDIPAMFRMKFVNHVIDGNYVQSLDNVDIPEITIGTLGFFSSELVNDYDHWDFGRISNITNVFQNEYKCLNRYKYFIKIEDFEPGYMDILNAYEIKTVDNKNVVKKVELKILDQEQELNFNTGWLSDYIYPFPEHWRLAKFKVNKEQNCFETEDRRTYRYVINPDLFDPERLGQSLNAGGYLLTNGQICLYRNFETDDTRRESKNIYAMFSNVASNDPDKWLLGKLDYNGTHQNYLMNSGKQFIDIAQRKFSYLIPFEDFDYKDIKGWKTINQFFKR